MPAATILRLARVIRAAIVASLTRNRRAISLTVSPATRRNVSAALDPAGIAGWQHMKISRSRSSAISTASAGWSRGDAAARSSTTRSGSLRAAIASARKVSSARRRAAVNSHPAGFAGTPLLGQVRVAAA